MLTGVLFHFVVMMLSAVDYVLCGASCALLTGFVSKISFSEFVVLPVVNLLYS